MTECLKGEHEFPIEDDEGAYCEEHGVTLLWHGPPITPTDLAPGAPSRTPPSAEPGRALCAAPPDAQHYPH